ncbi:MAG: hypothetical protein ABSG74_07940 [Candidatus Bathyarchaeia archaeon]
MTKAISTNSRKANRAGKGIDLIADVRRLGGLDRLPADPDGYKCEHDEYYVS